MTQPRQVDAWAAGLPPVTAVPTGTPLADGSILCILALVPRPEASAEEVEQFVRRFRFVSRHETARAADSQVRWSIEANGVVSMTFTDEEGMSALELPPEPGVRQWALLARSLGGTVSVTLFPGLTDTSAAAIGRRMSQPDGEYWHLSAGFLRV